MFEFVKDNNRFVATKKEIGELCLFPINIKIGCMPIMFDKNEESKRRNISVDLSLEYSEKEDTVKLVSLFKHSDALLNGQETLRNEVVVPKEDFVQWFVKSADTEKDPQFFQYNENNTYQKSYSALLDNIRDSFADKHVMLISINGKPEVTSMTKESLVFNAAGVIYSNGVPIGYLFIKQMNLDTGNVLIDVKRSAFTNKSLKDIFIMYQENLSQLDLTIQFPNCDRAYIFKINQYCLEEDSCELYCGFTAFTDNPFNKEFSGDDDIEKMLRKVNEKQENEKKNRIDVLTSYLDIDELF